MAADEHQYFIEKDIKASVRLCLRERGGWGHRSTLIFV